MKVVSEDDRESCDDQLARLGRYVNTMLQFGTTGDGVLGAINQALEIVRVNHGSPSDEYVRWMNIKSGYYSAAGDQSNALDALVAALDAERAMRGDRSNLALRLRYNMAAVTLSDGNVVKATALFEGLADDVTRADDVSELQRARLLLGIGRSLGSLGAVARGRVALAHAAEAFDRAIGEDSAELGLDTIEMDQEIAMMRAALEGAAGDFAAAERFARFVLKEQERVERVTGDRIRAVQMVAMCRERQGAITDGQRLLSELLVLARKQGDAATIAYCLWLWAGFQLRHGAPSDAAAAIREALERDPTSMQSNPRHAARVHKAQGEAVRAAAAYEVALSDHERQLAVNLAAGTEEQKLAFASRSRSLCDEVLSFVFSSGEAASQLVDAAATAVLRRKGAVVDAVSRRWSTVRELTSSEDRALVDRFKLARTRLAELATRDLLGATVDATEMSTVEREVGGLEAELSERSAALTAMLPKWTAGDVAASVPSDSALVEYVRFVRSSAPQREEHYATVVLRAGAPARLVDLGSAAAIDAAVRACRQALQDPSRRLVHTLRDLYDKVVRPLTDELPGIHRLVLAPDSLLFLVPFEALIDPTGAYLGDVLEVGYLNAAREVLASVPDISGGQRPAVVMGISAFGGPAAVESVPAGGMAPLEPLSRGFSSDAVPEPLPGADAEAREIAGLLADARLYVGRDATKRAILSLERPRLLHIATHGFFLENEQEQPPADSEFVGAVPLHSSRENPLLRSGLLTAECVGPDGRLSAHGVVSALELSLLDLRSTELVVLSACETGLGDIANGEGVLGLRRAMTLAGAASQIMSLWKVPDEPTALFMRHLYAALGSGVSRATALRRARAAVRSQPDLDHPLYWASFVLVGESGPLRVPAAIAV